MPDLQSAEDVSDACDWCERFRPDGLAVYRIFDAQVLLCPACKQRAEMWLNRAYDAAQAEAREERPSDDDRYCPDPPCEHEPPCGTVLGEAPTYPRREGDVIVIGPECIATLDESVIAWRGRHYTAGLESLRERVAELGEGDVHGRYGQAIRDVLAEIDLLHEPA